MRLIVGLGNPGPEYQWTPHNLGFLAVDELANRGGIRVERPEAKALVGLGKLAGEEVILAKPQTFMNLSGESVSGLLAKADRSAEKVIVVSDDLALPFGSIRIRPKGTHGGHNGLRSIIDCLKTNEFTRLRIGILPEHPISNTKNFVLENFTKEETKTLEKILEESAEAVKTIISNGVDAAMARFN